MQYNVDIAFVQEPYTLHKNVAGFPKGFKIFAHGGSRKRAAIIINNKEVDIITIAQGSHKDAILTKIRYKGQPIWGQSLPPHRQRYSNKT
jgi:ABC-type sulfate transport system substrate-binding protein